MLARPVAWEVRAACKVTLAIRRFRLLQNVRTKEIGTTSSSPIRLGGKPMAAGINAVALGNCTASHIFAAFGKNRFDVGAFEQFIRGCQSRGVSHDDDCDSFTGWVNPRPRTRLRERNRVVPEILAPSIVDSPQRMGPSGLWGDRPGIVD